MTFRRKVDNGVKGTRADHIPHQGRIADVAVHKGIAPRPEARLGVGQVGGIARVGHLVQVDDGCFTIPPKRKADEVGSDKPGSPSTNAIPAYFPAV